VPRGEIHPSGVLGLVISGVKPMALATYAATEPLLLILLSKGPRLCRSSEPIRLLRDRNPVHLRIGRLDYGPHVALAPCQCKPLENSPWGERAAEAAPSPNHERQVPQQSLSAWYGDKNDTMHGPCSITTDVSTLCPCKQFWHDIFLAF
jgi:hypothetical protein